MLEGGIFCMLEGGVGIFVGDCNCIWEEGKP